MDFREGSSRLTERVTLADIASETGMSHQSILQARLDPAKDGHRSPPTNWPAAIVKLARERAAELLKLAEELEG